MASSAEHSGLVATPRTGGTDASIGGSPPRPAVPFPSSQPLPEDRGPGSLMDALPFSQDSDSRTPSRNEAPPDSDNTSAPTLDRDSINDTSRNFASITAHDTPKATGGPREFPKGESVRIQGKSIMTTMGPLIYAGEKWVDQHLAGKLGFNRSFLNRWSKTPVGLSLFDFKTIEKEGSKPMKDIAGGKRWLGIPEKPQLESELYTPFTELITAVLKGILKHGPEREVHDTHNKQFTHFEEHHSSPDIVVRGTGPSFQMPGNGKPVGYSNVVTFFELKLDGEMEREGNLDQLVVYVRQIFIHQPNRMFVRGVLLSQHRIQLFHFDHAGIQRTPFYNIHETPAAFLGTLLALSTTAKDRRYTGHQREEEIRNPEELALDRARYLELVDPSPVAHHRHIRGSGSICWKARDPEAEIPTEYLVKNTWTSQGRTPEWELLARVNEKGIRGVAVMAWHEECIAKVSAFRCGGTLELFFDRILYRLVMETYGLEVENFKSVIQLLRALRDALAGHGNLYGAGILHRDISNKTILLGREGAPVGDQGILIDLSSAFDYHRGGNSQINKEPLMTSRFFLSCAILDFLTELNSDEARALAPAHDYLDDLESFFFVLCFLFFGFLPNGAKRAATDSAKSVILEWDSERADLALARKNMLLTPARRQSELAVEAVRNSWGEACATLFQEFMDWVVGIQAEKARLRRKNYPEFLKQREEILKREREGKTTGVDSATSNQGQAKERVYLKSVYASLYLDAQEHYDQLLEMFRKAIIAVETSPAAGQEAPKVSILNDPTVPPKRVEPAQAQSNTGPIPLNLGTNSKRRRYDSTTEKDAEFKVPELPASKAIRRDDIEGGNGDAWSMRATGSETGDAEDPFV